MTRPQSSDADRCRQIALELSRSAAAFPTMPGREESAGRLFMELRGIAFQAAHFITLWHAVDAAIEGPAPSTASSTYSAFFHSPNKWERIIRAVLSWFAHRGYPDFVGSDSSSASEHLVYYRALADLVRREAILCDEIISPPIPSPETPKVVILSPAKIGAEVTKDHHAEILQALLELNAFDAASRKSTLEISRKALPPGADPAVLKQPLADLKRQNFVGTKRGRTGGAWLTATGNARARELSK